jgi:hypothetical protein
MKKLPKSISLAMANYFATNDPEPLLKAAAEIKVAITIWGQLILLNWKDGTATEHTPDNYRSCKPHDYPIFPIFGNTVKPHVFGLFG